MIDWKEFFQEVLGELISNFFTVTGFIVAGILIAFPLLFTYMSKDVSWLWWAFIAWPIGLTIYRVTDEMFW